MDKLKSIYAILIDDIRLDGTGHYFWNEPAKCVWFQTLQKHVHLVHLRVQLRFIHAMHRWLSLVHLLTFAFESSANLIGDVGEQNLGRRLRVSRLHLSETTKANLTQNGVTVNALSPEGPLKSLHHCGKLIELEN